jgi:hypothetical protein
MSNMNNEVHTAGPLGPLGQFIQRISTDPVLHAQWRDHRAEAIAGSGLTDSDQQLLVRGDANAVKQQIVVESGGPGSRVWICVWIA